jgi:hypothetical protein
MKKYIVNSYGYYNCPEFSTIEAARAELKTLVECSLSKARLISKQSRKHKLGADSYSITLGSDAKSNLYSVHYISSTQPANSHL